jgi:hypothetical protein
VQRTGAEGRLFRLLVLLAAAALAVLLLRPICEATPRHFGHADRKATCCASASQPSEMRAANLLTPGAGSAPAAIAVPTFLFLALTGFAPRAAFAFASAPPRRLPYHARSLRILR